MLKYISLLGTNAYLPCNYHFGDISINDCCYIQKALLEILIKQDIVPEKIAIFTTEYAYKSNWIENKFDSSRPGLKEELYNMSEKIGFQVENIFIPEGYNEDELWEIFKNILNELEENDEIILDITHSFRYLPMLTFIVINYARIVKKCSLKAVYYGAFEVLGPKSNVKDLPIEKRNAPVFDLTPFIDLFDWTIAIDRYLETGDASNVENLTLSEIKKINKEINKSILDTKTDPSILFKDPKSLKNLSDSMKKFSDIVFTCRGSELTNAISLLKKNIDNVLENTIHERIKPLSPIMDMLKKRFEKFSFSDEYINVIETAKWCYDNKMYQQGLTILEEGLINYVCDKWNLDKFDKDQRNLVAAYTHIVNRNNIDAHYEFFEMEPKKANDLFTLLYNIGDLRNDINHAGWRKKAARISTFESSLKDFINRAEAIIYERSSPDSNSTEKQMLLIFSHKLTARQRQEIIEKFKISKFIKPDPDLLNKWANIPPDLENLKEYLADIIKWIDCSGKPGDYALIQGDFGATVLIVDYCISKGITPVYATSQRKVIEEKSGETIKISREFKHMMFREYQFFRN